MNTTFTETQWQTFDKDGYVKLGKLDAALLQQLQERIDAIMHGEADLDYERLQMQLDSATGNYGDAGKQTLGFKGKTLNYRKIQNLEMDPLFSGYLSDTLFIDICRRVYGRETPIAIFRAMFMNKPANRGTYLPWHQDRWTKLDRDPKITIWTAMDPATIANGCLQVIPGSHRHGLINPTHPSGFLSEAQAEAICTPDRVVHIELEAGEVVLLHNYLLHASDINRSSQSRRAFSVCYMDADTLDNGKPNTYTRL